MKYDPIPLPAWVLSAESAYPCPCGGGMDENFVVVKGEKGLVRLYHPECIQEYLNLDEDEDNE